MTALLPTPAHMSDSKLAQLRAALQEQAAFRRDQIAQLQAAPHSRADLSPTHSFITLTLEKGARQALAEVDAAQQRLANGTYGFCTSCSTPLPLDVLEVLPAVADCVTCRRRRAERG